MPPVVREVAVEVHAVSVPLCVSDDTVRVEVGHDHHLGLRGWCEARHCQSCRVSRLLVPVDDPDDQDTSVRMCRTDEPTDEWSPFLRVPEHAVAAHWRGGQGYGCGLRSDHTT